MAHRFFWGLPPPQAPSLTQVFPLTISSPAAFYPSLQHTLIHPSKLRLDTTSFRKPSSLALHEDQCHQLPLCAASPSCKTFCYRTIIPSRIVFLKVCLNDHCLHLTIRFLKAGTGIHLPPYSWPSTEPGAQWGPGKEAAGQLVQTCLGPIPGPARGASPPAQPFRGWGWGWGAPIPPLLLPGCMTLGKMLHLTTPQSPL